MERIKKLILKYFQNFAYFFGYLGHRVFVSMGLSLMVGVLDGFGLAMFLPLLQMVDDSSKQVHSDQMGNLSFLVNGLNSVGINLTLQSVMMVILTFFTLKGLMKFVEGYYRVIMEQTFIRKIRFSNIDLLSRLKYKTFVTSDAGRIQNTFGGEVERVILAYRTYFTAFQYGVLVLVYVSLAFMANAQFAILVAVGGVITNFAFQKIYGATKRLSRILTEESNSFQGLLMQKITNFKYLKASGLILQFGQKLKRSILGIEATQRRIGVLGSFLAAVREPLVILVVVSVILIQVNFFSQGLGLIILSLLFFYRSLTFLMSLQNYWNTFLSVSGSMENMSAFTRELSGQQEIFGQMKFGHFNRSLRLEDLTFGYSGDPIVKNVSLEIRKNETVAIVGESGSGKTTLMNVLTGLLQVDAGTFLIDDLEASRVDINSYQSRIGYITQEPVIFDDTVFNNVTFWDVPNEVNKARFEKALKMALIHEFVQGLPARDQTPLGNNGIRVSGGQRQRLSIARELYKDVDFLFMDEATSSLDSETERSIQENLDQLKGRFTIVIIAHRLSTIRNADKIIFMNKGSVERVGSFASLRDQSESFKRMVELQMV